MPVTIFHLDVSEMVSAAVICGWPRQASFILYSSICTVLGLQKVGTHGKSNTLVDVFLEWSIEGGKHDGLAPKNALWNHHGAETCRQLTVMFVQRSKTTLSLNGLGSIYL